MKGLEALNRLVDFYNLPSRNPIAYMLEQENLNEYANIIKKELKALEIIKETPEFAWYVSIYKNALEMICDVKGFRTNNSVEELEEMFELLKEVLL